MSDEQPAPKKRARKSPAARGAPQRGSRKRATQAGVDVVAKDAPATLPVPASMPTNLIRVPLSVRWRDLDAFNHVNNSKFLSYLEEARLRWMIQLPGEWIDDNVAPVVAAAHVNYRRPIAWPNEIMVELFVERLGGTSLTIGHRIVHADDASVLYADGNVVMVWIDKQRGQPSPLPDAVRKACS
jgi:YbgC/YbaW family acyl-CoA thioester hydrolase